MIAVDTSVIVAIAKEEPSHRRLGVLMAKAGALIGAPTMVETKMVLSSVLTSGNADTMLSRLTREAALEPVDFTVDMADVAVEAFRRFGKGRGHPARLNFGDCMSYAVAKVRGLPLLYVGDDFTHTDIEAAWHP